MDFSALVRDACALAYMEDVEIPHVKNVGNLASWINVVLSTLAHSEIKNKRELSRLVATWEEIKNEFRARLKPPNDES